MATEEDKGKATTDLLKGHLKRTVNQLAKAMTAKDIRTSKLSYDLAMDKISRMGKFLKKLETVEEMEEEWIENKLNVIDTQKDVLCDKFAAILLMETLVNEEQGGVENELQEGGMVGSNNRRIPKNNAKKPPQIKDTASLKKYEEWHAKVVVYFVLI